MFELRKRFGYARLFFLLRTESWETTVVVVGAFSILVAGGLRPEIA